MVKLAYNSANLSRNLWTCGILGILISHIIQSYDSVDRSQR
jgi:hypothetical protein